MNDFDLDTMRHAVICGTKAQTVLTEIINGLKVKYPHGMELVTIKTMEEAVNVLAGLDKELRRRYALFLQKRVRNIRKYNEKKPLPRIVVVKEEFHDFDWETFSKAIKGIASLAPTSGIYFVFILDREYIHEDVIFGNFATQIDTDEDIKKEKIKNENK